MALAGLMGMAAFLAVGWVAFLYAQRSQNRFQLFARLGLGLLGLCLVVRIALALTIGSDGVYGSDPYPRYAENLATGQGYSYYPDEPKAYLPPGWPMVLSGFYFLFGVSNWTILLATTLIGIGLVLIIWKTTSLLLGPGWGLVGANIAGWHPAGILYPFSSNSDLPFEFLAASVLLCALLLLRSSSANQSGMAVLWGLVVGVSSGLMLLTRAHGIVYFGLVCLVTLLALRPRRPASVVPVLAALLVGGLVLAGWTTRNVVRFSEPVVISTNGGKVLWIGNHPDTTLTHNVPNPPDGWTKESLAELSEYERDSVYGRAALETIRDRPGTFLINGVKKTVLVYANDTAPISGFVHAELSDVLSNRTVLTVLVAVFNGYYWSLLALGAIGWLCLILRKQWLLVALLGSAPAIVAGIAFVFTAEGRYHWFAMPSLVILSVVALSWYWKSLSSQREGLTSPLPAANGACSASTTVSAV